MPFTPPPKTPHCNYSFISLVDSDGGSESFTNWSAADLAVNSIIPSSFGVIVYELSGTGITGDVSVADTFGSPLPKGTFGVAYGRSGPLGTNGACPGCETFSTPFTQSGLVTTQVPEPGPLPLFGTGLLSLAGVTRHLRRSGE